MSNRQSDKFKEIQEKELELRIYEVEDDAVIVNVDGWRIRVYLDLPIGVDNTLKAGGTFTAIYTGDIKDIHSIKFKKITKV